MKTTFLLSIISLLLTCCSISPKDEKLIEQGVSYELSTFRKQHYKDVEYNLKFSIPEKKEQSLDGNVEIKLKLEKKRSLILDFRADANQIQSLKLNNKEVYYVLENEHIIIDSSLSIAGENKIQINFTPNDQSLNRREEFLYTLLVPDRARTLFPCFDQPNLKSFFTLTLEIPDSWNAVANSAIIETQRLNNQRKILKFGQTEPLSTYLFSFVAGEIEPLSFEQDGREISVYHRETDAKKIAQCKEIADEVFDALKWMEAYTGIPYPFSKYDLIILPGFQYGGMEHTGATLYNDRRMFLDDQPTINDRLGRSALIAHETAHMWFGDYVTMEWFNDVWTKEVFANYFASQIVEPLYPEINHKLNFMIDYFPKSYAEDRTLGTNPIQQPLDNLSNAGLVYGNIIYDKSPIVFQMLIQKIGEDAFRLGIQDYLKTYAYSNATWNGLISCLQKQTTDDLQTWSHTWVKKKGMPKIDLQNINQGSEWTQKLQYWILTKEGHKDLCVDIKAKPAEISLPKVMHALIPNVDGRGYGFFKLREDDIKASIAILDTTTNEVLRGSLLITLYENVLNQTITSDDYITSMLSYIRHEKNTLLFSLALGYINGCQRIYPVNSIKIEECLWEIVTTSLNPQHRLLAFRHFISLVESKESIDKLYAVWEQSLKLKECALSENDYIKMSYVLAILLPEKADQIVATQLQRIQNPDRRKEYQFVKPSVSPRETERDSVFNALLIPENRRVEPWAAAALTNINHHTRQKEALKYIRPGLDVLSDVQRTGDIFFPTAWVRALFSGHTSQDAMKIVDTFFQENPDYPPMLSNKIKQQADPLYRANKK